MIEVALRWMAGLNKSTSQYASCVFYTSLSPDMKARFAAETVGWYP
jgi:hypothetical protein